MKKILVLVLVFGFVGFAAFAQSAPAVVMNGDVESGFQITAIGSADPILSSYNDSAPGIGNRFNLTWLYDAKTWGLRVRLRNTNDFTAGNNAGFGLRYAYGWFNLMNGMINVKSGLISDTFVKTGSGAGNQGFGAEDPNTGVSVDIGPFSGLRLFYFLPYGYSNVGVGGFPSAITSASMKASDAFQSSFLGAAYYAQGMGDIELGYQLATSADNNSTLPVSGTTTTPYAFFDFGVAYTGMQNLTAYLEAKTTLASTSNTNFTYLGEKIAYAMAPLTVTLWGEQQFGDTNVHGTFLNFQPHVDYVVGPASVGAMVDYGNLNVAGTTTTALGFGPYVVAAVGGAKATLGLAYQLGGSNYMTIPILGHVQYGPDMNEQAAPLSDNAWTVYALLDYAF